jgi:hypothetical protein
MNMMLSELAHLKRRQGLHEQALSLYRETILTFQDIGHRAAIAHQLECFAFIAADQGNDQRAAQLFGAAETLRNIIEAPMTLLERADYDLAVDALHSRMGSSLFERAWAQGNNMNMNAAIAYALEETIRPKAG